MPGLTPLPRATRELIDRFDRAAVHPGLLLDKFARSWDPVAGSGGWQERVQRPTLDAVVAASRAPVDIDYADLLKRHTAVLRQPDHAGRGAGQPSAPAVNVIESLATEGPLTLHLSRTSALENSGICLHPVYGFAYLPGTGLKGIARAYAETVWFAAKPQAERAAAWRDIEHVFGWAPRSDELDPGEAKPWKPADAAVRCEGDAGACGMIVFHDAWPTTWPRLVVDIVNNHHPAYYDGKGPPGDWENPVPVYFLCIPPKQGFSFALSRRRGDDVCDKSDDLLHLAWRWLQGGLAKLGFGAKTNAGYGGFGTKTAPPVPSLFADCDATLELITPAFLAGAAPFMNDPLDCDLRPATLRGLLRWWWRTMHTGFVSPQILRRMESAVWGDTAAGGAVRVVVDRASVTAPRPYDKRRIADHEGLPEPPDKKTTQGLWYHSYGMDDQKGRRFYVEPGTKWDVTLSARPSRYVERHPNGRPRLIRDITDSRDILRQAEAALWLLCHFGGAGSKSRRGFGCFADPPQLRRWSLGECQEAAAEFRRACGVDAVPSAPCPSPSLQQIVPFADVPGLSSNCWDALDQVGQVAQQFAQRYAHNREKKALGLPRNVRPLRSGGFLGAPFLPGPHVKDRHASPVFYHLYKDAGGTYGLRVTAFPSAELPHDPSLKLSRDFLDHLLRHLSARTAGERAPVPKVVASEGKKIAKNHAPRGILKRVGGNWTAMFTGDATYRADARNVRIANVADVEKLPGDADGKVAKFYIKSDDKHGIVARFDGLV